MQTDLQNPFYKKLSAVLISIALLCVAIIYGQNIILPILFAILLANLLLPVTQFLSRKKFYKILTIILPLLATIIVGAGILYLLSSQIFKFVDDMPALKERFNQIVHDLQLWFKKGTSITITKQNQYFKDKVDDLKEVAPGFMGSTMSSITNLFSYFFLIPIYTFLILFYRSKIKVFLIDVFKTDSEDNVKDILTESTSIAQKYMTGLLIETSLVFTLNVIGFLILGIKYAVFLALLAALLNLIPYVGMLVANILCMLITLVSSADVNNAIGVGIVLALVQFLDNNFGMPLIVGNKVRINALVTIIGVLVGGALCGIPGMFLAIPALAFIKVICDKVTDLQPWGKLLGDNPEESKKNAK